MAAKAPQVGVLVPQDPVAESSLVAALLFAVGGAARAGGAAMVLRFAVTSCSTGEGCRDARGDVWVGQVGGGWWWGVSGQLSLIDVEGGSGGVSGQAAVWLAGDATGLGRRPARGGCRRLKCEIAGCSVTVSGERRRRSPGV